MDAGAQFQFPPLPKSTRNLIFALLGAYVIELLVARTGVDLGALIWHPLGDEKFAAHQLLTHFLVQGESVFGVVMALLVIYFLLPGLRSRIDDTYIRDAFVAAAIGSIALPLALDITVLDHGVIYGWATLAGLTLVALFGLFLPNETLLLMFVLPVPGRMLLIISAILSVGGFLISPSLASAEPVGVLSGIGAWWFGLGPGARKRQLRQRAAKIERELNRFQVIEGGRTDDNPGAQGSQGEDKWVN
jgi:hypothetical protein